jgi:hypothetical protein
METVHARPRGGVGQGGTVGRTMRAIAMIGAAVVLAIAPWVAFAPPAGAAQNTVNANALLTYKRFSDQSAVTCGLGVGATHNTDDPRRPFVIVSESVASDGVHNEECIDSVSFDLVVTYTDTAGDAQRTEIGGFASANISGAKANVHVTLSATYLSCDSQTNTTCKLTVAVAPK